MQATWIALATGTAALLDWFGFGRGNARRRRLDRLAAPDPQVVARAASEIAQERRAECEQELLRSLKVWSARDDRDAAVVCLFLLDALIRTDAVVPAAAVRPLLGGLTEVAAFVLMARSPALNELELMATFREHGPVYGRGCRDLRWIAEGNLLCQLATPGFAGVLLRDLDWSLSIDVVDVVEDGGVGNPCRLGVEGLSAAGGQLGGHVGFPPLPAYALLPAAQGGTLLADGPIAVAYRRELARSSEACGVGITNLDRRMRAAWLERLVDGIEVQPTQVVQLTCDDPAVFAAAVERSRDEFHARRRRLFAALAAAGALTPAEIVAGNRPLQLLVRDVRSSRAVPLPPLGDAAVVCRRQAV